MNITGKAMDTFVGHIVGAFDDYYGATEQEERDLHFIKLMTFYMSGCAFGVLKELSVFMDVMAGVSQNDVNEGHKVFYEQLLSNMSEEAKALYDEYEKNRRNSNDD